VFKHPHPDGSSDAPERVRFKDYVKLITSPEGKRLRAEGSIVFDLLCVRFQEQVAKDFDLENPGRALVNRRIREKILHPGALWLFRAIELELASSNE
jgi:hypothetical protein